MTRSSAPLIQPPEERFTSVPVPFHANDEARSALLPYLALGFAPCNAPGRSLQCGFHALSRSYGDAREALQPSVALPIDHATPAKFIAYIKTDAYKAKVDRQLASEPYASLPLDMVQQQRTEWMRTTNIDINQINFLLEIANQEYGTDFELGYITQGYRCKYDEKSAAFDNTFVVNSTTTLFGAGDGRPIIWLYNDNSAASASAWNQPKLLNHWEGLGLPDKSDIKHRQIVEAWNLAQLIDTDLAVGVWRVIATCPGGSNALSLSLGHFVRDVPAPQDLVIPEGWRYMKTCNDAARGLVPEAYLSKIVKHARAPRPSKNGKSPVGVPQGPVTQPPAAPITVEGNTTTAAERAVAPEQEEEGTVPPTGAQGPEKGGNDDAAPQPEKQQAKKQQEKQNQQKKTGPKKGMEGPVAELGGRVVQSLQSTRTTFRVFRVVDPTSKVGKPLNNKKFNFSAGGFPFKTGDFLLDCHQRGEDWLVRNIQGVDSKAFPRSLQRLEHPWRLPGNLQVLPAITIDDSWDKETAGKEAKKRGLKIGRTREETIKFISTWEANRRMELPMRIVKKFCISEYSRMRFFEGEMVLEISKVDANGNATVIDFEGREGHIQKTNLDTVKKPWGLALDQARTRPVLPKAGFIQVPDDDAQAKVTNVPEAKAQDEPTVEVIPTKKRKSEGDGAEVVMPPTKKKAGGGMYATV